MTWLDYVGVLVGFAAFLALWLALGRKKQPPKIQIQLVKERPLDDSEVLARINVIRKAIKGR